MRDSLSSYLEPRGIVQDAIHGSIPIYKGEYMLLQTPFLRRLHGIKQLGMAFLVFPTATHTRLGHSIGVMHVASRMVSRVIDLLARDEAACRLVARNCRSSSLDALKMTARLAGLIHDLGHYPYSHTVESIVENILIYGDRDYDLPETARRRASEIREYVVSSIERSSGTKLHEIMTYRMAVLMAESLESEGHGQLASSLRLAASSIINPYSSEAQDSSEQLGLEQDAPHLIKALISHRVVDADRLDYLKRDAWFTGVVYGYIDIDRICDGVRLEYSNGGITVGYEKKSMQSIEDLFDSRFKMYRSVYYHHKVLAFSLSLSYLLHHVIWEWDDIRPDILSDYDLLGDLFNPKKLPEHVASGSLLFDDGDLDLIVKVAASRGSRLARRWAKPLLADRRLTPITLIKRQDELSHIAERILSSEGPLESLKSYMDLSEAIVGVVASEDFQEAVARNAASIAQVSPDDVKLEVKLEDIGGSEGSMRSLYISLLDAAITVQMPIFVYIYSDDERTHLDLYRSRDEIRRRFLAALESELKMRVRA